MNDIETRAVHEKEKKSSDKLCIHFFFIVSLLDNTKIIKWYEKRKNF